MRLLLNQRRLNDELAAVLRRMPSAVSRLVRGAAFDVGGEVVRSLNGYEAGYPNPKRIDTGRYRAGWAMGVQEATGQAIAVPMSSDPENPSRSGDGAGQAFGDGLRQRVRVSNNVEYAEDVELGTPEMKPGLHVTRALLVGAARLREAIGEEIPAAWRGDLGGT